ncbi:MAG: VanZ family protein [Sphaerochaetaceae bacterium]|jgi:VanZ family protein
MVRTRTEKMLRDFSSILSLFFTMLIVFLSLENGSEVPQVKWIPFADKGLHACAYAVLSFLVTIWFFKRGKLVRTFLLVVLYCFVLGVIMELLQPSFGRYREFLDLVSDVVGCLIGFFLSTFILCLYERRTNK